MSPVPLLAVEGLDAHYGAAQILFGMSLDLKPGEAVALMGRNGAGKSTTMKSLMGLVSRRARHMTFRGHDISRYKPYEIAQLGLGYVPEDRRIFSDLTVTENLEIGRQAPRVGFDGKTIEPWSLERLFAYFPNLADARMRAAGRMSGGEQQMLAIARTLMGNPYAILLDEPSEGIAPVIIDQIADIIGLLKANGVAILLSEQNLAFAASVSDRVYVLEKGEVKFSGTMRMLEDDDEVLRHYLSV
jgi:branched-chain amino acid transport system ATP-binding protein